ncbi:DUF6882 domain-containing protein [uncultured Campylobacter sp.]|uniref:DUF6882 domain-containing protein n=1 Tax=uncultured Campylobacter sp. TaxID=218934 RepID=UPI00262E44C7|nr:DUF6882 domain-containing protein [uncultured Campylobacter sp.]
MKFLDRLGVDRSSFADLFSACLGCGVRAQEMGSKLIVKGRHWSVDFERSETLFGDDAPRAILYIGSEANASRTWLWGYENINHLDERLLTLARDVRDFDLRHELAELGTPKLALSAEINGHALSAIACGLSQEPLCYYRCPHAGGAVFVAFAAGECVAPDGTIKPGMDASELISLARDYIGAFQLNHAVLSGALLLRNGTKFSEATGKIVANFKNDALFSFDNLGRLSEVEFVV